MRVAEQPEFIYAVHKIVQLLFQPDVVQFQALLQDCVVLVHPGSGLLSRLVKQLLVDFASYHKMF